MTPSRDDSKFSQPYVLYTPKERGAYPIQEPEWDRLKRMIKCIVPAKRVFQNLSSASLTLFVTALFALIAFLATESPPAWATPTCIIVLAASAVLAVAFLYIDSQQRSMIRVSAQDVLDEMDRIEENYERVEAEEAAPSVRKGGRITHNRLRRAWLDMLSEGRVLRPSQGIALRAVTVTGFRENRLLVSAPVGADAVDVLKNQATRRLIEEDLSKRLGQPLQVQVTVRPQ